MKGACDHALERMQPKHIPNSLCPQLDDAVMLALNAGNISLWAWLILCVPGTMQCIDAE